MVNAPSGFTPEAALVLPNEGGRGPTPPRPDAAAASKAATDAKKKAPRRVRPVAEDRLRRSWSSSGMRQYRATQSEDLGGIRLKEMGRPERKASTVESGTSKNVASSVGVRPQNFRASASRAPAVLMRFDDSIGSQP